jgi:hypothetical protein
MKKIIYYLAMRTIKCSPYYYNLHPPFYSNPKRYSLLKSKCHCRYIRYLKILQKKSKLSKQQMNDWREKKKITPI